MMHIKCEAECPRCGMVIYYAQQAGAPMPMCPRCTSNPYELVESDKAAAAAPPLFLALGSGLRFSLKN
jgi:Zn finger protein HypA/HybF involved in hydrogenase expression